MSNDKNKEFNDFVDNQIKRINEYFQWEELLNDNLLKKANKSNQQFVILDKEWIEKWKDIIGYEKIKKKCKTLCSSKKEDERLKNEIKDFFLNSNAKQKIDELGKMDTSKIIKKSKNKKLANLKEFDEESDFVAIDYYSFNYFKDIEKISATGDFIKGKLFLRNNVLEKKEKNKIVIIEKNKDNNQFNEIIYGLEPNEEFKTIKNKLKEKTIEEMKNDSELKNKIKNKKKKEINYENKNNEE